MKGEKRLMPTIFSISRHQLSDLEKRLYYSLLLLAAAGAIVCFWGFISLFVIFLEFISLPNQSYISPEKLSTLLQSGNTAIYRFFVDGLVGWGFIDFLPRLIFRTVQQSSNSEDSFTRTNTTTKNRIINTGNGIQNNGSIFIERDYIQNANFINMSSDLSQAVAQFQEILTQLQVQGYSPEEAQQLVANELATQAQNNPKVRKKLSNWSKSLGDDVTTTNVSEAATAVVNFTTPVTNTSSNDLRSDLKIDYRKLEALLKDKKWKEADEETINVMLQPCQREEQDWLEAMSYEKAEYIRQFPRKDLETIDTLWAKYSRGRFGFRVQKRIWNEVKEDYDAFGTRVGWRVEGKWIYRSDIDYSLDAPFGHLPAKLIVWDYSSDHCDEGYEVLEVLAERHYK
jgi:uncharacterized protein YoaH (UPF0181 family)